MGGWFEGFASIDVDIDGVRVHARTGGRPGAPPLLLLHGFPQTHAMWHRVAQALAPHFALVLADLRGYGDSGRPADGRGDSGRPAGGTDHAAYGKRAMAADLHALMQHLGHARYAVCGHDRGARVAHRLALDRPEAVTRLALIDIAPTLDMYAATDTRFATAYYHWFHLIQPYPLPETMIFPVAREYLHAKLGGWGSAGLAHLEPQALAEYERCFCDAGAIHAACEDYRASAGLDLEHDRASRAAGQRIGCDTLVVVGGRGVVQRLFDVPALWRAQCAAALRVETLDCGHFVPEERPAETAALLAAFFGAPPSHA